MLTTTITRGGIEVSKQTNDRNNAKLPQKEQMNMEKEYGYCRISTPKQNIDRQERKIKAEYPNAHISKEAYTGTKTEGRRELEKILKVVKPGDTIVFDSV